MFNLDLLSSEFISVILTSYRRPSYLIRAIKSIHRMADVPFELIIHDDGGSFETQMLLDTYRNDISFTMLNNGLNSGLNRSINRCISLASSKYIFFMCDDCWIEEPCFKQVIDVLSKPYIGWVCPGDNRLLNNITGEYNLDLSNVPTAQVNGTRFGLTNNLLGAFTLGFRKEVWQEVKGWEEQCSSGRSDNVFLAKLISAGYWKAVLEGKPKVCISNNDKDYRPSAPMMKGDNNLPLLFNISDTELNKLAQNRLTKNAVWEAEQLKPGGLADLHYWFSYFFEIFSTKFDSIFEMKEVSYDTRKIDWDIASKHGQSRQKEEILNDFK